MCGQTNCWILPRGQYGCFKAGEKDVYVMSHRAARNMSFQDILMPWGKPELLCEVTGQDLMGCKVEAPTSPDDFAAFMDLMKPAKRDHFKIKEEWVVPFKLIPIIDVEIDDEIRHEAARYMCEKLGVQSQNDTEKLHEAHDVCYKLGFDKGVMTAGVCKGQPVKVAKLQIRSKMVEAGQAMIYSEPEKKVVSRSGDECVVAGIDQWFLRYGEPAWK